MIPDPPRGAGCRAKKSEKRAAEKKPKKGLGRDLTQAAMTAARAELAAFDDGVLREQAGGTKDLRLKQDVQYWAACSLIVPSMYVEVAAQ